MYSVLTQIPRNTTLDKGEIDTVQHSDSEDLFACEGVEINTKKQKQGLLCTPTTNNFASPASIPMISTFALF